MRGLNITQENLTNQQGVVKNEVKVNVLNQPYGGFPWLDLPQIANTNWYNAHNFYGDLAHLDAATLDDVRQFFKTYYAPNNAVLVVTGDIDPAQTLALGPQVFLGDPVVHAAAASPTSPSRGRRRRSAPTRRTRSPSGRRWRSAITCRRATRPSDYAMGLIDQILVQGKDSRLYQALVQKRGFTGDVTGGTNILLGNMFDIKGPTLWTVYLIHDADKKADEILAAIDEEIARLQKAPLTKGELELALVKRRSRLYAEQEQFVGFGRANLLASFALFDDDPGRINRLEDEFAKVTPELIQKTAVEYLPPDEQDGTDDFSQGRCGKGCGRREGGEVMTRHAARVLPICGAHDSPWRCTPSRTPGTDVPLRAAEARPARATSAFRNRGDSRWPTAWRSCSSSGATFRRCGSRSTSGPETPSRKRMKSGWPT